MIDQDDRKFVSCGIQTNDDLIETNKKHILLKKPLIHLFSPRILNNIHYINSNNNILNKNNNNYINNYNNINNTIQLKKRNLKNFEINENTYNINMIEEKSINQKKLIIPKIEKKLIRFPINTFGINSIFQKYKNTIININLLNKNNNNNSIFQNNLINSNNSSKLMDKKMIRKRSLNSFEKISTKNNGDFLFIGFKEELSKPNLYRSRSYRGNIQRIYLRHKNYFSNKYGFFTFKNKQNKEC
jgi:hypothetical protein